MTRYAKRYAHLPTIWPIIASRGLFFVGLRNDGACAQLSITDKLLLDLSQMKDDGQILPYGNVNPDNFGQPGVTDYRNPMIAEAMKVLGFVQRFGMGIPLARKELEKNGNPPPEFQFEGSSVLVTLRIRS